MCNFRYIHGFLKKALARIKIDDLKLILFNIFFYKHKQSYICCNLD